MADAGKKPTGRAYLRYLLLHPAHLFCLGGWLVLALASSSIWMLLPAAVGEGLLVVSSRLHWVRRAVDRHRRRTRREQSAQQRTQLIPHMDPGHVTVLRELERRVATARNHAASVGEPMESLLDERIDVDRLLGTFVRLSIIHRAARESLAMTDRSSLSEEVDKLERYRERAPSWRLRELADRELILLRRRLGCHRRNSQSVQAIARDLSAVASACRLVHERALSLLHPGEEPIEVERLVTEAQMHDEALGELLPEELATNHGNGSARNGGVEVQVSSSAGDGHEAAGDGSEHELEPALRGVVRVRRA